MSKSELKRKNVQQGRPMMEGVEDSSASAVDALVMCDLVCEYCGIEFHGDFKQAVADGWQHGHDASFCPKHNV